MKVFGIVCFIVCVAEVQSATVSGVTSENNGPTMEMATVDNGRVVTNTTDTADLSTPEVTTTNINPNATNPTDATNPNTATPSTITDAPTKAPVSTTSHITEASSRATPAPSAPTFPSPTTEQTETSTSPQLQKDSQTGTIVGVAFGMLILGAILGVVGVYIFQRYRARGATGYELNNLRQY